MTQAPPGNFERVARRSRGRPRWRGVAVLDRLDFAQVGDFVLGLIQKLGYRAPHEVRPAESDAAVDLAKLGAQRVDALHVGRKDLAVTRSSAVAVK